MSINIFHFSNNIELIQCVFCDRILY